MRLLTFASLIFLISCSQAASKEEKRKEYDSLTKQRIQIEKEIEGDKQILEVDRNIKKDEDKTINTKIEILYIRRIDSLSQLMKGIEERRAELSKDLFSK
jgi:plastocyanin domain-containing protein